MTHNKNDDGMPNEVYFANGILYNTVIPKDGHGAYIRKGQQAKPTADIETAFEEGEKFGREQQRLTEKRLRDLKYNSEDVMTALNILRGSEVISRGGRYVAIKISDAQKLEKVLEGKL